jgi:hypothetical protein
MALTLIAKKLVFMMMLLDRQRVGRKRQSGEGKLTGVSQGELVEC